MKVDFENGVIEGVSVITVGEALGHIDKQGRQMFVDGTTLDQVLEQALKKSKGLKVKADHGSGVFAIAGYLQGFKRVGEQILANFNILKSEKDRDKILEMADTMPEEFGFSISFDGDDDITENKRLARCENLYSADLVDQPAANPAGLFCAQVGSTMHLFSNLKGTKKLNTVDKIEESTTEEQNQMTPEELSAALEAVTGPINEQLAAFKMFMDGEVAAKDEKKKADEAALEAGADEEKDKAMKATIKSAVELATKGIADQTAAATVKALSAQFGGIALNKGAGAGGAEVKKDFNEILEAKIKELNGDKGAALKFCVKNFSVEHREAIDKGTLKAL